MKDSTGIGVISGLIASLVFTTIQLALYYTGIMNYTLIHIWSQIVIPRSEFTPIALTLGFMGHIFTGLFFAVIITYYLKLAGTDYLWLKGLVWGGFLWIIRIGVINNLFMRQSLLIPDSSVAFGELITHIIYCYIITYTAAYFLNQNTKTRA